MWNTLKMPLWRIGRYPVLLLLVVITTHALSNLPAFYRQTSYLFSHMFGGGIVAKAEDLDISSDKDTLKVQTSKKQKVTEGHLVIPRLDLDIPVVWQVANRENEIQKNLENGVVNIAGTSLPGDSGNVFITGHSSNYIWSRGDFKTAFVLLGKTSKDDLAYIKYSGTLYVYRIETSEVVKPNRLDVMQKTKEPSLTLMTCTPIGTSINRLVIRAKQIYPPIPVER